MAKAKKSTGKKVKSKLNKKLKKKLPGGKAIAYINSSYNNTLISITDLKGEVISNSSPGVVGFKGARKNTAYAATKAAEDAAKKSIDIASVQEVDIIVKGLGMGRNAAIKGLRSGGLKITTITDKTPIPHGGPTPRKAPRGS